MKPVYLVSILYFVTQFTPTVFQGKVVIDHQMNVTDILASLFVHTCTYIKIMKSMKLCTCMYLICNYNFIVFKYVYDSGLYVYMYKINVN